MIQKTIKTISMETDMRYRKFLSLFSHFYLNINKKFKSDVRALVTYKIMVLINLMYLISVEFMTYLGLPSRIVNQI